jgi:hypothetical protein
LATGQSAEAAVALLYHHGFAEAERYGAALGHETVVDDFLSEHETPAERGDPNSPWSQVRTVRRVKGPKAAAELAAQLSDNKVKEDEPDA